MSHHDVLGVVVLARNGDREEYYQDPVTYQPGPTLSTPLGEVQAHQLGHYLRNTYLNPESSSHVKGVNSNLVDLQQVHVRVKVGGEGSSVFDSATALLQGLFPPNPNNRITLANGTTVVAPLNGYQYIPVETVEPSNDRSLESWTDCPAFQKHVEKVLASSEFREVAHGAQAFFTDVRDFVFGRPTTMENWYNVWDYMNTELVHNRTYAHRLLPTFIEHARGLANFRENAIFSDPSMGGIGNIASRTALSSIIESLQRIAYNGDPLQFMLIETTYQPFISLFHQTEIVKSHPELAAIPDYGSALAIELRRSRSPDTRDFLRFKFKNGTNDDELRTVHVFGHPEDIPLTEFIYRLENSVINSNADWARACHTGSAWPELPQYASTSATTVNVLCGVAAAFILMLGFWLASKSVRRFKHRNYVRLQEEEESRVQPSHFSYNATGEKARMINRA
ncbi:phosphoglycerate mutase-like protein [Sparassis latifolia]